MKQNERLQALTILTTLLEDNVPLSQLLQSAKEPSSLTKEICFGVCRHYFRLQALLDCLLNKRPKAMEVWVGLLIGLYQLHYLNIPDYAVVKETVALLDQTKKTWAKGLVNAVLRTFCRKKEALLAELQNNPLFMQGHPEWFSKQLRKAWPKNWQAILAANDTHPPMTLRVHRQSGTTAEYLSRLQHANIEAQTLLYAEHGLVLDTPCDVHTLPGFSMGEVSVQDEAAQLAVTLLDLKRGLRLLDACCAPGGKTCHILETQTDLCECVALDIDKKRLARVQENLTRLHLKATIQQGDALQPNTWWDGVLFDRILLDAPCSATGVIRRHPDIKLLRTPADITAITTLQQHLLQALWPLLAPGGRLVYATCSVMPEENEQQIAQFVASQPDCQSIQEEHPWGHATGHGWQIFPGEHNMDGFFYSVLLKG